MVQPATSQRMDPDAFLIWEREQPARHVYFRGEIFAMAGGSPRHSRLASRIIARLDSALSGKPCDVHTSDLRLGIADAHFAYADVAVVCRPLLLRPGSSDVVVNPTAVFEVLSKSTERYDRGEKQAAYLALPSLNHFVLVSQRQRRIETYAREADGSFRFRVHLAGETVSLDRLGVTLNIDELYDGVFELPADDEEGSNADSR